MMIRRKLPKHFGVYCLTIASFILIIVWIFWNIVPFPFQLLSDLIIFPFGCLGIFEIAYYAREPSTSSGIKRIPFILVGFYLGSILNVFLSVDFLVSPSPVSLIIVPFFWALVSMLGFRIVKKPEASWDRNRFRYEKPRCLFLGVSFSSIFLAAIAFYGILISYLPLVPQLKLIPSLFVRYDFYIIVNIFKSLFLTALFGLFERLVRVFEES